MRFPFRLRDLLQPLVLVTLFFAGVAGAALAWPLAESGYYPTAAAALFVPAGFYLLGMQASLDLTRRLFARAADNCRSPEGTRARRKPL